MLRFRITSKLALAAALLVLLVSCDDPRRRGGGGGGGGGGSDDPEPEVPEGCDGVDCSDHGRCATAGGVPVCVCDPGYYEVGLSCKPDDPCDGVDCSDHGTCELRGGSPYCDCEEGYRTAGPNCVSDESPCDEQDCSGHGSCIDWGEVVICACDPGYTPSGRAGLDCVPTETICKRGAIYHDVDDDGTPETWFEPSEDECEMFELINHTRAIHDPEGTPECHHALMYCVEWSAHGRNHSKKMFEAGHLYHDDVPGGQNCAYGCGPECEMNMYMHGPDEPHCPAMSHHCNIMHCSYSHVGVGYYAGTWNTQNFY